MKNVFFIVLSLCTILACAKEEEDSCKKPSGSVGTSFDNAYFGVQNNVYDFLEVEYGVNGFVQGMGTTSNIMEANNLAPGAYDYYVRGNCGGLEWSDWSNVSSFYIQP